MHVHLAAKGLQIKSLFLLYAHHPSITQQNSGVCGYSEEFTAEDAKGAKEFGQPEPEDCSKS
jgi:hypothetical protein